MKAQTKKKVKKPKRLTFQQMPFPAFVNEVVMDILDSCLDGQCASKDNAEHLLSIMGRVTRKAEQLNDRLMREAEPMFRAMIVECLNRDNISEREGKFLSDMRAWLGARNLRLTLRQAYWLCAIYRGDVDDPKAPDDL